jgi:hypothetical protein
MCGLFSIDYSYPNNIKKADPEGLGRKNFKIWTQYASENLMPFLRGRHYVPLPMVIDPKLAKNTCRF